MTYCVNCKQGVKEKNGVSDNKIFGLIVWVIIWIGFSLLFAPLLVVAAALPIYIFKKTKKICPICKDSNWDNSQS